jgi:hypothetical protein
LDGCLDLANIAHVHLQWEHAPAPCGNLGLEAGIAAQLLQPDGQVRARLSKCKRDGAT